MKYEAVKHQGKKEKATVWMRLGKLQERVQKQYKDIFTLPTYRMHF